MLIIPFDEMTKEGYESDGQCGLFIDNEVMDDEFCSMNKDISEDPVVVVIAEDEGEELAPEVP